MAGDEHMCGLIGQMWGWGIWKRSPQKFLWVAPHALTMAIEQSLLLQYSKMFSRPDPYNCA